MGFVKTPEEISRIQAVIAQSRFTNCEMLMVSYLTRPELAARVLPPGVEPANKPAVTAMVGRWQSNCVGDFTGGALYVAARHNGVKVTYILAMYIDTDSALIYGREVLGEPKKQAQASLTREGNTMAGSIERRGARLMDLRAELTKDLEPPRPLRMANLNVKAWPAADGSGLEDDALLTLTELEGEITAYQAGAGSLTLGGSQHDPLDEMEVVEVLGAFYLAGDLVGRARTVGRIPGPEFLPYFYARQDVWPDLATGR